MLKQVDALTFVGNFLTIRDLVFRRDSLIISLLLLLGVGVVMLILNIPPMLLDSSRLSSIYHGYPSYARIVGDVVSGWSESMISLWFLGSAILLSVGVIGEYIGKIYSESKQRPLYFEDEFIGKA